MPVTTAPAASSRSPAAEVLRRGDHGPAVVALQEELTALGYWLGRPDGEFGLLTEQAVLALQGVAGLSRDGQVGVRTRAALQAGTRPTPRSTSGHVVEIARDTGVLVVAHDGLPALVLHTSTGTFEEYEADGIPRRADTPAGRWNVLWAHDGWRTSDLGRLYRPRYFHPDGIAVHGYASVPAYPASHGCVRVTVAAMDMIWAQSLMPLGSPVLVY